METRSTFFERTARAVRSQLSKHSARNYGYKASEMILIYRDKIYDRGTCWHMWEARESKVPQSGHAREAPGGHHLGDVL